MPPSPPTIDDLKRLLIQTLQLEGTTPETIGDDDPLVGGGLGLDSVDALELVVALEKRFRIKIRSEEVDARAFASMSALHRFLQARIAEATGASG